jgi:hypothetical protein
MYGILMRYTFENEVGGAVRFSQLAESLHALVSINYAGEMHNARMVFRFIVKYTVQGLQEIGRSRPQLNDMFWKNMQLFLHTIYRSIFDDQLADPVNV